MAKVFISHASEDREPTDEVNRWLVDEGHEVFLDQHPRDGIEIGDDWEQRLNERLRWADAVVCVVTSAFLESEWCTQEVACARARGSRLLPIRAEPRVEHKLLKSLQYADLSTAGHAALVETLRRLDATGGLGWADDRSPFPGLRPFEIDDHRVFFGRRDDVNQLANLLRSPTERAERAVLLVVGPSGSGKSSLVRAGLRHEMIEEPGWWTLPPILPGIDPMAALARELANAAQPLGLKWTMAKVRHQLDDTGLTGLADELLQAIRSRRLLVVVDQFEELITQAPSGQRARFAQLLRPALGGPVQMVATMRPEFLSQLLADSDLAALPTRTYTLRPLRREALRAVIQGPARLAGIGVDEDLMARLVDDTDSGEALPLLAFTLNQLASDVGRGGQLSSARYEQLGGVQGALTRQADAALIDATKATGRSREEVIAGLLQLVTVDEQDRPIQWRTPWNQLPEPVTRELDAFVERRLLTTDTNNGSVVVGVAHEAILSVWPPLAEEIENKKSALRARRVVEQAATEWNDNGCPPARLWEGGQLAAARSDIGARFQAHKLVTDRVELNPTARKFLRDSIRRDRLRRGRSLAVLSVLLILALVAAVGAVVQQRKAVQQRNIALSQTVAGQSMKLRDTNPALAAQLSLAAYRLVPTAEARSSLLNTVTSPYATRLTDHTNRVYSVAFSPDSRMLATAGREETARLWDIGNPQHPHLLSTFSGHNDSINSVFFSPDGHTLATASNDRTARLWDIRDPHKPSPLGILNGHRDRVGSAIFSPDGRTLVTSSSDDTAMLWDVNNPNQPNLLGSLTAGTKGVVRIALSLDGYTLATAGADNTARLWDIRDPRRPMPLGAIIGHGGIVSSVAFSPDGHTLATGSLDRTARLWDIRDPRKPSPLGTSLPVHANTVSSVAFSPDGNTLATASNDEKRNVRLWDVHNLHQPSLLSTLTGHTKEVNAVAFSPDGHTLATASHDTTARLWDIRNLRQPSPLSILIGHTDAVSSVAFRPDSSMLATSSHDGTARLWDIHNLREPSPLATFTGHTREIYEVAFSRDGHTLATASLDGTARLWETDDESVADRVCHIAWPRITEIEWEQYLPGLSYRPPCPAT